MLKVNNFSTGYGKIHIIRNMNFEIDKGKIISIIGRNGVGKSTLIKGIMGLLPAFSGDIYFQNEKITNFKTYKRANMGIGYVPQGHGVFPNLTVLENIKMGENINKNGSNYDYEVIYELFPRLKERIKQKAGTLSGGERAQLSISRALIGKPNLIVLDEPSEGVQPNLVELIGEIIKNIKSELGLTVLLVEQHMGMIKSLSDVCYAIDKGSIVGSHEANEIKDEVIQKYLSI